MGERGEPERRQTREQPEEQQRWDDAARVEPKTPVEPVLLRQPCQQIKGREGPERRGDEHFGDMLLFEMADFMSEHRLELRFRQLLNERVEEHNLPKAAKPGEECIRVPGTF